MTNVKLHGILGKKFREKYSFKYLGKPFNFINAIEANSEGFKKTILNLSNDGMFFEMFFDGERVSSFEGLAREKAIKQIDIVPSISGNDPVTFFISLAVNLLMSGIMYLLTPAPEVTMRNIEASIKINSFLFSTPDNVTQQGVNVPLGYGRLRIGSRVIGTKTSYVDIEDYSMENFLLNELGTSNEDFIGDTVKVINLGYDN